MGFPRFLGWANGFWKVRTTRVNGFSIRTYSSSKKFSGDDEILPVLIVGAGPVGLVLSILLTKLSVKCAVLEKSESFSKHPQAHVINTRSMEIFRGLDNLAEKIQSLQPPVDSWRKFLYCTSLSGSILGSVDHMQSQDLEQVISPVSLAHFSQYKLSGLLLEQLESLGFSVYTCDALAGSAQEPIGERKILMGHECMSIEATDHAIIVGASCLKEGKKVGKNIQCSILIGSDGARSTVRKLLGIEMQGTRDLQKFINVHFMSRDLGQYLLKERPGMLFFIFNVEAIGVIVAHDLVRGEFVLQIPFYPPQQNPKDFNSQVCKELIFKLAGQRFDDVDVIDIKSWVMHAEVAEKYVSCNKRVILVGDSAHRFPPAGGFGMNTGIQDAHNLAWKIACLVKGIAPPSILQTYETERRPVALCNTELSLQNFDEAMSIPLALGLDPTVANSIHRVINSAVGSILPSGLQRALLNGIFTIGRTQVLDSILNENNPFGSSRLAKLRRTFDERRTLQLHFPAEDLGFRYTEGAVVSDSDSSKDAPEAHRGRRRDYVPSAEPGSRMPHMYMRLLPVSSSKETFSTLDLLKGDELVFLLVIAPKERSYNLARAVLKVAKKFNISLKVSIVWSQSSSEGIPGGKSALDPWVNYVDVEEVKKPSSPSWWEICKITDEGAILVRPDGHVAWSAKVEVLGDHVLRMEKIFSQVLGIENICP